MLPGKSAGQGLECFVHRELIPKLIEARARNSPADQETGDGNGEIPCAEPENPNADLFHDGHVMRGELGRAGMDGLKATFTRRYPPGTKRSGA